MKKEKIIYVVQGNCGEYSDRTDWLVMAFTDQEKAIFLRNELDQMMKEFGYDKGCGNHHDKDYFKKVKQVDPQFMSDYTGTYYAILTVPLG